MKYLIQPKNEGQDLNYSEIKDFKDLNEVITYVRKMVLMLKKALPQGDISAAYEKY